jgi:hypothetical protein
LPAAAALQPQPKITQENTTRRCRSSLIRSRRKTTHQKTQTIKTKPSPPPICFDPSLPPSKTQEKSTNQAATADLL